MWMHWFCLLTNRQNRNRNSAREWLAFVNCSPCFSAHCSFCSSLMHKKRERKFVVQEFFFRFVVSKILWNFHFDNATWFDDWHHFVLKKRRKKRYLSKTVFRERTLIPGSQGSRPARPTVSFEFLCLGENPKTGFPVFLFEHDFSTMEESRYRRWMFGIISIIQCLQNPVNKVGTIKEANF